MLVTCSQAPGAEDSELADQLHMAMEIITQLDWENSELQRQLDLMAAAPAAPAAAASHQAPPPTAAAEAKGQAAEAAVEPESTNISQATENRREADAAVAIAGSKPVAFAAIVADDVAASAWGANVCRLESQRDRINNELRATNLAVGMIVRDALLSPAAGATPVPANAAAQRSPANPMASKSSVSPRALATALLLSPAAQADAEDAAPALPLEVASPVRSPVVSPMSSPILSPVLSPVRGSAAVDSATAADPAVAADDVPSPVLSPPAAAQPSFSALLRPAVALAADEGQGAAPELLNSPFPLPQFSLTPHPSAAASPADDGDSGAAHHNISVRRPSPLPCVALTHAPATDALPGDAGVDGSNTIAISDQAVSPAAAVHDLAIQQDGTPAPRTNAIHALFTPTEAAGAAAPSAFDSLTPMSDLYSPLQRSAGAAGRPLDVLRFNNPMFVATPEAGEPTPCSRPKLPDSPVPENSFAFPTAHVLAARGTAPSPLVPQQKQKHTPKLQLAGNPLFGASPVQLTAGTGISHHSSSGLVAGGTAATVSASSIPMPSFVQRLCMDPATPASVSGSNGKMFAPRPESAGYLTPQQAAVGKISLTLIGLTTNVGGILKF